MSSAYEERWLQYLSKNPASHFHGCRVSLKLSDVEEMSTSVLVISKIHAV